METYKIQQDTKDLIDRLKATTSDYGLAGGGKEYIVIVQTFLYKFLNDKFIYEIKKELPDLKSSDTVYDELNKMSVDEYDELCDSLFDTISLNREHLIPYLLSKQNEDKFSDFFDAALEGIAAKNDDVFFIQNEDGSKVSIIKPISNLIDGSSSKKNDFCKALIGNIGAFSFESVFDAGYDFFSTIFEYLLKDYNANGGGNYAEYYTPHSVASIMSQLLVGNDENIKSVTCYDPAAGTGTLLIALAHAIGESNCTVYTQDISEKSSTMMMLNLILNRMSHSLSHVIQGNTLKHPFHKNEDGSLKKFDYVVSNPPFKLDFSGYHSDLKADSNKGRFFAGIPNIKPNEKESMEIYLCFFQHVLYSIKDGGKGAIVVPTGFLTGKNGIPLKIRKHLIENKFLKGAISMPSNIFANTNTNVSVVFIDKSGEEQPIFIDASKLGKEVKDDKNKKTVLSPEDVKKIVNTFLTKSEVKEFSVIPSIEDIKKNNYKFSAGQYFDIKIDHIDISEEEFNNRMKEYSASLDSLFGEGEILEKEIKAALGSIKYE